MGILLLVLLIIIGFLTFLFYRSFVADVRAESPNNDIITLKQTFPDMDLPLNTPLGKIIPERHWGGFSLRFSWERDENKVDCQLLKGVTSEISLGLLHRQGEMNILRTLTERCGTLFSANLKKVIGKEARVHITEDNSQQDQRIFELYNDITSLLKTNENCQKQYFRCQEIMKRPILQEIPLLDHIVKLMIAMKSENVAWAKKLILEQIHKDPREMVFYYNHNITLGFLQKKITLSPLIFDFFTRLKLFLRDEVFFRYYLNYWSFYLQGFDFDRIQGSLGGKYSLSEVENYQKYYVQGKKLHYLWYDYLCTHESLAKGLEYLKNNVEERDWKGRPLKEIAFIFSQRVPEKENEKKYLQSLLGTSKDFLADGPFIEYLALQLSPKDRKKESDFAYKVLKSNKATEWAIFQLLKLASSDMSLFPKMFF